MTEPNDQSPQLKRQNPDFASSPETSSEDALEHAEVPTLSEVISIPSHNLDARLVGEIHDFIVANNGPDDGGLGHPRRQRLPYPEMCAALNQAQTEGHCLGIMPYHFRQIRGLYHDQTMVDLLLVKKFHHLLTNEFGGDVSRMCAECTTKHVKGPILETAAGRDFKIQMGTLFVHLGNGPHAMLRRYLELTTDPSDPIRAIRDYHFRTPSQNCYDNPAVVDEVLCKKIDHLLSTRFTTGGLPQLIREVRAEDLLSPFSEEVAGRDFTVKMGEVGKRFANSPSAMISRYIEVNNLSAEYPGLRSYHFETAGNSTYLLSSELADEVLVKKIDQLLIEHDGDLLNLCLGVEFDQLTEPFEDQVGEHTFVVSPQSAIAYYGTRYAALQRYIELKGREEEFSAFRPYHMARSGTNTFEDEELVTELIVKKVASLLENPFEGDLAQLMAEVTDAELRAPFVDTVAGRSVPVSMIHLSKKISSFEMACCYIQAQSRETEFWGIRPYHMSTTENHTFQEESLRDEIVIKKINSLLAGDYDGNLARLCAEVNEKTLAAPFTEEIAGRVFRVSTTPFSTYFHSSPYRFLRRYIDLQGLQNEYAELKPYHMKKAPKGTYQDASVIDSLLEKKVDQLLEQEYGGDLKRLLVRVRRDSLLSPLIETVAGHPFEVKMAHVGIAHRRSTYEMIKRYHEVKGLPFPYTPECFQGPSDAVREQRITALSG